MPGERMVDLLHLAAAGEASEIDGKETRVLEDGAHLRLGVAVVPGDEDDALAACLVGIRAEHVGAERVRGLHDARAGNEVGNEFARCSPVEVLGLPVVGCVDHDPTVPFRASDSLRHAAPRHRDDDDRG